MVDIPIDSITFRIKNVVREPESREIWYIQFEEE